MPPLPGEQRKGQAQAAHPGFPSGCLCLPFFSLPSPGGAKLSNPGYAAWPVYLGVSGQGCPSRGGPDISGTQEQRERGVGVGERARQRPDNHCNSCLCQFEIPMTELLPSWKNTTWCNPHNNSQRRKLRYVVNLSKCHLPGTVPPSRAVWLQRLFLVFSVTEQPMLFPSNSYRNSMLIPPPPSSASLFSSFSLIASHRFSHNPHFIHAFYLAPCRSETPDPGYIPKERDQRGRH